MFDYLAVLISVVLGLAMTHVLTGASSAINRRHHVPLDWLQLFWGFNVLAYVLAVWWGMYWWKHLAVCTVQAFAFLTGYAIVLFLYVLLVAFLFVKVLGADVIGDSGMPKKKKRRGADDEATEPASAVEMMGGGAR